jgi:hypothetical protein
VQQPVCPAGSAKATAGETTRAAVASASHLHPMPSFSLRSQRYAFARSTTGWFVGGRRRLRQRLLLAAGGETGPRFANSEGGEQALCEYCRPAASGYSCCVFIPNIVSFFLGYFRCLLLCYSLFCGILFMLFRFSFVVLSVLEVSRGCFLLAFGCRFRSALVLWLVRSLVCPFVFRCGCGCALCLLRCGCWLCSSLVGCLWCGLRCARLVGCWLLRGFCACAVVSLVFFVFPGVSRGSYWFLRFPVSLFCLRWSGRSCCSCGCGGGWWRRGWLRCWRRFIRGCCCARWWLCRFGLCLFVARSGGALCWVAGSGCAFGAWCVGAQRGGCALGCLCPGGGWGWWRLVCVHLVGSVPSRCGARAVVVFGCVAFGVLVIVCARCWSGVARVCVLVCWWLAFVACVVGWFVAVGFVGVGGRVMVLVAGGLTRGGRSVVAFFIIP